MDRGRVCPTRFSSMYRCPFLLPLEINETASIPRDTRKRCLLNRSRRTRGMFLMQWLARTFGSSFPAVLAEFQDSRIFNASNTHQFLLPTKDGHRLTNDRLVWSSSKERRESCICILLAEKAFLYAEPPTKRLGVYVFGETNCIVFGNKGGSISDLHRSSIRFRAKSSSLVRHVWSSRRGSDLRFL